MSSADHPPTPVDLDAPGVVTAADPSGMLGHITGLPEQIRQAWEQASDIRLPEAERRPSAVLILGMGGSAIAGDLARDCLVGQCPVPLFVSRDYTVPAWVGEDTLVIASSYSGNTEETLTAVTTALERQARVVGITTGGQLEGRLQTGGCPVVPIRYESQPRAALGCSLLSLFAVLRAAGLVDLSDVTITAAARSVADMVDRCRPAIPRTSNPAKQLATRLHGSVPVIYSAGPLASVGRRWKTQFNENSKSWAFWEELPELNHNSVLGYRLPPPPSGFHVVLLESSFLDQRVRRRFEVTRRILDRWQVAHTEVGADRPGPLEEVLSLVALGDFVSLYLAVLYGVDPTPVGEIDFLKAELGR